MNDDEKGYNGWTNRDTWALKLHMYNNEGDYTYWQEATEETLTDIKRDYEDEGLTEEEKEEAITNLSEKVKDWYNEIRDNVLSAKREYEPTEKAVNLIQDIGDDNEINYKEIAGSLINDLLEEQAYAKKKEAEA
jgi:shikimate kinase